jgi:hypothetical protein
MANDSLSQRLLAALAELVEVLETHGINYALIGGLAASYRSRPRFTQDIDVLLQVPQIKLPAVLEDLSARGFSFEMEPTIQEWIQHHMVALDYQGVRIDWLKPVVPCFQSVIATAEVEHWLGRNVRVASAEGLIVMKLLSFRTRDLLDIENLLAANRGQLDLARVWQEWENAAMLTENQREQFQQLIDRLYREH